MNEIGRRIADKIAEIYRSNNYSIAFLPYKRSMWNSMESVYEECIKSGAEVYCIPIPYYLMPDKIVNSEKDLFDNALDVAVLGSKTFDFVVIHYPYDHNNKVTQMLPEYHTACLKRYGQVIYIPYSCTNMRQLRVQPGLANIDYAFLNTKEEAASFINEWKEMGVDFTGKVFGLGSPKMDSISKCAIDGDTTVIINSLGPFLSSPLSKIRSYEIVMLDEINEGHQVIFRPHPLLRQTIKSMRPDMEYEYDEFIGWAKWIGVQIDESEYLEETLSKASMLISDPSSVLEMWMSTGREYKVI